MLMGTNLEGVFREGSDDMGVTAYKDMTYEALSTLLGFPEGRPPLFSKFRSKDSTINSWDPAHSESPKWTQGGEGLQPLTLKWHQLCGVVSCSCSSMVVEPMSAWLMTWALEKVLKSWPSLHSSSPSGTLRRTPVDHGHP